MRLTRREFVKTSALATAGLAAYKAVLRNAYAYYKSPAIPLFNTALRGVGPGGIPVALPSGSPAPVTGAIHYAIGIQQFSDQILPRGIGLGPTTLWGFVPTNGLGGYTKPTHLGGIIVAEKGVPIQISFQNRLTVARHIVPVDTTIPGANQAPNRTAIHIHGGLVPWISDGGPFDWFDPYGNHGLSFLNNQVLNPSAAPGWAEYYYPMNQSARMLWYHDHAWGITRLNAYAGIASALLLRDGFERNLMNLGLPNYIESGGNEIPLVFQDKVFVGNNINNVDPLWSSMVQKTAVSPGSLWYAHTYEPSRENGTGRWDLAPGGLSLPDPSCIPEFFGDTMLVNGTAYPEATVEARRYRLRLLNACNARFLNLQLYVADNGPEGITLDSRGVPRNEKFVNAATGDSSFLQIGTEGGFLSKPAKIPCCTSFYLPPGWPEDSGQIDPTVIRKSLLVAPAERPDLIVDFSYYAGKTIVLYNDAPSPYPAGDDRNDFFPGYNLGDGIFGLGNPANTGHFGFGPNTRVLMRFKVVPATGVDSVLAINTNTDLTAGIDTPPLPWGISATPPQKAYPRRFLTLNEYCDAYGRLIQIIGDENAPLGSPLEGSAMYLDPETGEARNQGATEQRVENGTTEVWEIYNMTGDVHPMHFHLVNVQLINRQLFDESSFPGHIRFLGRAVPPEPNELGWKETVAMFPGTVTRVIMKFEIPRIVTASQAVIDTPVSPRTGGHEYVWHCHILEHEEHDMMHALVVD